MIIPTIAAALGAFLIILQTLLMLSTGLHRAKTGTFIGLSNDPDLERKMRRHGNLVENAALFVVVLALAELSGLSASTLTNFAIAFAIARVSHALAFTNLAGSHGPSGDNNSKLFPALRVIGAFGTALSAIGLGGYLAYHLLT